jgi:hypothetical protein
VPRPPPLLVLALLIHSGLAIALWTTGSLHGTWTFECGVGATAWDLAHGRNPAFAWTDYFDSWTSGYLLWALLEAPLMRLPWDPIYAVKAVSLLTTYAAVGFAYLFVREVTDRRWALVGAVGLLFGPPALWYYSQLGGNYHYTELVPCFALFWRLAVRVKQSAWGARGALELGLLAGLAVSTSLGSILPVALSVAAFMALRWGRMRRPVTWLAIPAIAVGLLPLLIKALHDPFGQPPSASEFEMPYFGGAIRQPIFHKVTQLPGLLIQHVGFEELSPGLWPLDSIYGSMVLAVAALALMGLLRFSKEPTRVLGLLPGLYVAGLLVIYLLLPTHMPPGSITGDYRDVRWLPPLLGAAPLAFAVVLSRMPRGAWAVAWVPVVAGLIGIAVMIPFSEVQARIPYSGRCPMVLGLYAGKVLPPIVDGEPSRADVCEGFGDGAAQCDLGRATSVAVYSAARKELRRGGRSPGAASVEAVCEDLEGDSRRACFRQLGWALVGGWPWRDPSHLWEHHKDECSSLRSTQSQAWCREGVGYWFADHLGAWPERLPVFLVDAPPQARELVLKGIGARLGWAYRDDVDVQRACDRYAFVQVDGEQACLEGASSVRTGE